MEIRRAKERLRSPSMRHWRLVLPHQRPNAEVYPQPKMDALIVFLFSDTRTTILAVRIKRFKYTCVDSGAPLTSNGELHPKAYRTEHGSTPAIRKSKHSFLVGDSRPRGLCALGIRMPVPHNHFLKLETAVADEKCSIATRHRDAH